MPQAVPQGVPARRDRGRPAGRPVDRAGRERSFGVSESCGVRTLKCSVSRHLSRAAQTIEEWVTELVVGRLSRSDAADLLVDTDRPDAAKLRAEAMAKRARLGQLTELLADGTLSADAVRTASARLKAELAGIEGPDDRRWPGGPSRPAGGSQGRAEGVRPAGRGAQARRRGHPRNRDVAFPGRGRRTFDTASVEVTPRDVATEQSAAV